MTTFKTLLLTGTVGLVALSGAASANDYVDRTHSSTNKESISTGRKDANAPVYAKDVVPVHATAGHVIGGRTVAQESTMAVGTRKVGHVGGRPYPIEATQSEVSTISATRGGLVEHTEVTTSGGPINVNNSGGAYYTETDGNYYADPAFNVDVHHTGYFNE